MEQLLLFLIFLIGSLIQGATGFGFAIFSMAILPFFLPFKTASAVVLILSFVLVVQLAFGLRTHINMKLLLPTIIVSFVGRFIGVYTLMNFNDKTLKIILGAVLIALSIYFAFFNKIIRIKPNLRNGAIAGLASGILGGMFNIGGPPLVIYYFSAVSDNMEYNGTLQATFVLNCAFTIILHLLYGNISIQVLQMTGIGLIAVLAGGCIGLWVFKHMDRNTLSRVIYSFMALMGIMMLNGS